MQSGADGGLRRILYECFHHESLGLRLPTQRCKFLAIPDALANMRLDGISSKHWYRGLLEVKKPRSKYFSVANVAYYHTRAVAMNLVARTMKKAGLSSVYRSYRYARDRHSMVGR